MQRTWRLQSLGEAQRLLVSLTFSWQHSLGQNVHQDGRQLFTKSFVPLWVQGKLPPTMASLHPVLLYTMPAWALSSCIQSPPGFCPPVYNAPLGSVLLYTMPPGLGPPVYDSKNVEEDPAYPKVRIYCTN